jgi:DEAD/DEAH box helicase domain-containing protein
VLSNPDMLHTGILPYHTTWAAFLMNLRYVVIDEIHTYRGVFGANVAQVIKRLRRICAHYGANPQFIACSATIANPAELMQALTGLEATIVDEDGAPRGKRTFVLWNPPLIGNDGTRGSPYVEAANLFTDLVEQGVRNITFTKARKIAELVLRYARESFEKAGSPLRRKIMSYRAGYTPEDRRAIEKAFFHGKLIGVTATNALELGIDVGGLEATILTGYPGTIASTWQQAGRAGRGQEEALTVLIALNDPLEQYLVNHPHYFFSRRVEQAVVDVDNRRILAAHLACAAYELPLRADELALFGPRAAGVVADLEERGVLQNRQGRWYYARHEDYPAASVNIRSASAEVYQICDLSRGGLVIGTVEEAQAFQTVHPGAIYLHQGETYLVKDLDVKARIARVVPEELNYYTEPREMTQITILAEKQQQPLGPALSYFGEVVVIKQVLGYRRRQLYSEKVMETVDLDMPEQVFETEALWFTVPMLVVQEMAKAGLDLCGAIHAAEHAAIGMMPLLTMCDRWDVGGVSSPYHPDTALPTVFIYDGFPGGAGISEVAFGRLTELLTVTVEMIESCSCQQGCPSCIQSPKCGNNNEPLDKGGAVFLLRRLLSETTNNIG